MKHPLVKVTWMDATRTMDQDVATLRPTRCHTVGYLVRKRKRYVVVAADKNRADGYRLGFAIPRGMVLRIQKL